MSFSDLLVEHDLDLEPPSDEAIAERADLHERLHVTDDYLTVYRTGLLPIDLGCDLPPDREALRGWEADVSILGRASSPEDMKPVVSSVFYGLGTTYGGGMVVQIARGTYRGRLATIEDSALGAFEYGEVPLPDAPVTDDAEADRWVKAWVDAHVLSLRELDLVTFLERRLQHVRT
jgi:hypothetical protein